MRNNLCVEINHTFYCHKTFVVTWNYMWIKTDDRSAFTAAPPHAADLDANYMCHFNLILLSIALSIRLHQSEDLLEQ